ncbi:cytochrome P450 [Jatrophihabitans sp.]|uniref:cytochrome P450 n=1 Tax=Jatrophihabitans sp. TaxID=1932789 RepID=UPI0030C70FB0|nr:cytochrome [Jatrophihabitans sp.]
MTSANSAIHASPEFSGYNFRDTSPEYVLDPFVATRDLRVGRALWSPTWGGFWTLTSGKDVRDCLQDSTLFSSSGGFGIPARQKERKIIPVELDPPEHGKYRQALAPFFGPRAVGLLDESLRRAAGELIDSFVQDGRCEFMSQFAAKFPTASMVAMLGLPVEDTAMFVQWNHEFLHAHSIADNSAGGELDAAQKIENYLAEAVRARQVKPLDDMISHLMEASIDGRSISVDEVVSIAFQLFIAGLDTVTAVLGRSFLYLATNQADLSRLVADPSLRDSAVEELLRLFPIAIVTRTATRDADFAGVRIREGQRILIDMDFWNRDLAEFVDPDACNFARTNNRHISFGAGRHRCLGSHLARLELGIAIDEFHKRIPEYRLDEDAPPTPFADLIRGVNDLTLVWDQQ